MTCMYLQTCPGGEEEQWWDVELWLGTHPLPNEEWVRHVCLSVCLSVCLVCACLPSPRTSAQAHSNLCMRKSNNSERATRAPSKSARICWAAHIKADIMALRRPALSHGGPSLALPRLYRRLRPRTVISRVQGTGGSVVTSSSAPAKKLSPAASSHGAEMKWASLARRA